MFQGHSIVNIDAKSRLVLPLKFRKYIAGESNNKLVLMRGMDKCILAYPSNVWEELKNGMLKYNVFDKEQRRFVREFLMFVNECDIDSQNRILLPAQLIQYANLKKEAIILGMLDKIEIWDPETKKQYDSQQTESYEEIAQKVSEVIIHKKIDPV